ncbi:hypothetical protein [Acetobacter cibinongensis]|uniref:Uncharacterized protein n=1 Tax=Acetobacter cibinongensis TaxID=146475 RepID=A0A1Z5YRI4_9PROT|nr:hypothetical protein [Acetobacter cibinongensis]OUI99283.1 hypothetical protein HK14_14470 [Acetobacter cibinongensis]
MSRSFLLMNDEGYMAGISFEFLTEATGKLRKLGITHDLCWVKSDMAQTICETLTFCLSHVVTHEPV